MTLAQFDALFMEERKLSPPAPAAQPSTPSMPQGSVADLVHYAGMQPGG